MLVSLWLFFAVVDAVFVVVVVVVFLLSLSMLLFCFVLVVCMFVRIILF